MRPGLDRRLRSVAVVAVLMLAVTACGNDTSDRATTTTTTIRGAGSELTDLDVERLAGMLHANYTAGGAAVRASVDFGEDQVVTAEGVVDWAEHRGELTVTSTAGGGAPVVEEVRFTEDEVFDPVTPAQAAALAASGRTGIEWVARPPDREQRPIDQVIGLLVSLAATRPDNPQLVAQRGYAYDGREEVAGRPADVYSSGKVDATYWLDAESGRLVRFRGSLPGFAGPIVVDLSEHGAVDVDVPAQARTVPVDELP